jgi:hypothetical protein
LDDRLLSVQLTVFFPLPRLDYRVKNISFSENFDSVLHPRQEFGIPQPNIETG